MPYATLPFDYLRHLTSEPTGELRSPAAAGAGSIFPRGSRARGRR